MNGSLIELAGIFLSGLALNLTPCVYPMLSVTVALFSPHAAEPEGKNLSRAFLKAFLYVLGMVLVYSSLGLVAAFTGQLFGAALQSPLVLMLFSVLMFALALSMFGFYEFRLPAFLLNFTGAHRRAGLIGIFLSGLLVGAFAAPCIGPPIVALLALVGQQQTSPAGGFLIFFVLSLGLGFPYLILGTFSGLLRKLPRAGEWLIWIKKLFGVILSGLSLYYLAAALYADLLAFVVPVTLIAGGLYLGFLDSAGNQNAVFRNAKRAAGALAIVAALAGLFWHSGERVIWEPYAPEKLELAKKSGKPVVIDFYADWCLSCHELERFTYSNPEVIRALEPFVRLKADLTHPNSEEAQELVERFDLVGVPTVVFLDAEGREVESSRLTGFVPPKTFLEAFEPIQVDFDRKEMPHGAG